MSYEKDFQKCVANHNQKELIELWEEYCKGDSITSQEVCTIFSIIQGSPLEKAFGHRAEDILSHLDSIREREGKEASYAVLKKLLDVQTTDSLVLAEVAYLTLNEFYGDQAYFNEKIRLIGLTNKKNFKGALRNYELLSHMDKKKFVFHNAGWGTGEIIDISLVREQLILEFENVTGKKDLSFKNAFNNLEPLDSSHFLARRFGDPDELEAFAKKDALALIHMLLKDLGPKNASEIKDELYELVIPADDWSKWWQNTRSKLKKDTKVQCPTTTKAPFVLRQEKLPHHENFLSELQSVEHDIKNIISLIYKYIRDFSEVFTNEQVREVLTSRKQEWLSKVEKQRGLQLSLLMLFEEIHLDNSYAEQIKTFIAEEDNFKDLLNHVSIAGLKKKVCMYIRTDREDWKEVFSNLFLVPPLITNIKDYFLKELGAACPETLERKVKELLEFPEKSPGIFVWYFQKLMSNEEIPFQNQKGHCLFFEKFLILLSDLSLSPHHRELVKKMMAILVGSKYGLIRRIFKIASIESVKEYLLLVSKCHCLSEHDIKIISSLASVAHEELADTKSGDKEEAFEILWTTEGSFLRTQERLKELGTVEMVKNAKEIEEARALGDLRENAEYKFALEQRSRLQREMHHLSTQMQQARIITKDDVDTSSVSVGCVVEVVDQGNQQSIVYTILGPWDADPDKNIISFKSQIAKSILGKKEGEEVDMQNGKHVIKKVGSVFEHEDSVGKIR